MHGLVKRRFRACMYFWVNVESNGVGKGESYYALETLFSLEIIRSLAQSLTCRWRGSARLKHSYIRWLNSFVFFSLSASALELNTQRGGKSSEAALRVGLGARRQLEIFKINLITTQLFVWSGGGRIVPHLPAMSRDANKHFAPLFYSLLGLHQELGKQPRILIILLSFRRVLLFALNF